MTTANILSLVMTGLGALMASAAVLATKRFKQRASLWLLVSACVLGATGLLVAGILPLSACSSNLSTMLAVSGLGAALSALTLFRQRRETSIIGALLLASTLGIRTIWPSLTYTGLCPSSVPFQMAAILEALAVGILAWGSLFVLAGAKDAGTSTVESVLAVALALQATTLVLRGTGAQWAWGSYWRWDAIECWHLAACLTTAIGLLGVRALNWRNRAARWALYAAACLAVVVSFGLAPLATWLGVNSLYVIG
ncbi:MAG: hypothetical protein U9R48_11570 [Chloroflexota bacterium]|nr:hypothetical protein [Chloroflexota bacterium]